MIMQSPLEGKTMYAFLSEWFEKVTALLVQFVYGPKSLLDICSNIRLTSNSTSTMTPIGLTSLQ